jgi:hypothetical protein
MGRIHSNTLEHENIATKRKSVDCDYLVESYEILVNEFSNQSS